MEKITREMLVQKYLIAEKKLDVLKSKKYEYKTQRDCQPFGMVRHMRFEDIVKAGATVHEGFCNIDEAIKRYGITKDELKSDERKYLGYTVDEWDADFKLRVEELRDEKMKQNYEKAIKTFKNNFTDDDKFRIEMGSITDMGLDLDDDSSDDILDDPAEA